MELTDLLPVDKWVELEAKINRRSGLNATVFDVNHMRITDFKKWANNLCPVIKANEKGQTFICATAQRHIVAMAQKTRKPVVEECDAGMIKIVAPVFVNGEFLGSVSGCGLLQTDEGKVETFLVNKTTGINEQEIEGLSKTVGHISIEDAEAFILIIDEEVNNIVELFEKT
jgi:ligand-binding sensor protein